MNILKTLFFLILFQFSFSQTTNSDIKSKISNSLIDFNNLNRENIFVHFNKKQYLTNEKIWFKGYVLDKKTEKLNFLTTNVFLKIYNENLDEITSQLLYTSNGVFTGQIELKKTLESGEYYVHFYTNYMNNFSEDESTVEKIQIINIKDNLIENIPDNSKVKIDYFVEGGKLLFDSNNIIGVHITNCQNKGVAIKNIEVKDSNNNTITRFSTNKHGYGRFEILQTKNENYTIKIDNDYIYSEKLIQKPIIEGVNIQINNHTNPNKISLRIITNQNSKSKFSNQNLLLLVQKNDFANYIDINLEGKSTKDIILDKNVFFDGVNTIRLLDQDLNLLSERVIYNSPTKSNLTITGNIKKGDSITIKGNIPNRIANLSISVVPIKSNSIGNFESIQSHLEFNNYLKIPLENSNYYFKNFTRKEQFELDIFMICNNPKYEWKNILNNYPKEVYTFDVGLTITGKINQIIKDRKNNQLKLFSINGVNEITSINENNDFEFNNILATDSTNFHFSLIKDENKLQSLNISSTLKNNKRTFIKKPVIKISDCPIFKEVDKNIESGFNFPTVEKITILDSVNLTETKKEKMNHKNNYYNSSSFVDSYKISETDETTFVDVLSFIASHGYDVNKEGGNVVIRARVGNSFLGTRTPVVFLDNMPLNDDLSILYNLRMTEIDEVYINKRGYGMGNDGMNGSIRIYTKKTTGINTSFNSNIKSKSLLIKNGFAKSLEFKNEKYSSLLSDSFEIFGTIHWIPNIYTDEKGNFEFTLPHYYQKKLQLNIQGIDNEGSLYYEEFEINN